MADGPVVHAVIHRAGGIARHAAGIGGHIGRVDLGQHRKIQREIQRKLVQIHARVRAFDIHIHFIPGILHQSQIAAHQTAGAVGAEHRPGSSGIFHGPQVPAHQAAHVPLAGDRTGKGAVLHGAAVDTGQAAHVGLFPVRTNAALQIQVPHHRICLQPGEQARRGHGVGDLQAGNGVAIALKGPAEGGNGGKARISQGNVRRQAHGLAPGPGVQGAAFGKLQKFLRRGNGERPLLCPDCRNSGKEHHQRQHKGAQAEPTLIHHLRHPPRRFPQNRRSGSGQCRPPQYPGQYPGWYR